MPNTQGLPPFNFGVAAALLRAREAVMRPLRPVLREHGLTEQQWRLLRVVMNSGPMEIGLVSDAAMLLSPSVSRIVREMVERGLIKKEGDAKDARRVIIRITAEGESLVHSSAPGVIAVLDSLSSTFGEKRLAALVVELGELAKAAP